MAESHWHCCHPVASSPGQWPQMGSARFTWLIHDSAKSLPEPCSCCSRVIPDSRCSRILLMQAVIWFSLKSFESSGQIWPVTRWPACGSLRRSCKSRFTGQSRSTKVNEGQRKDVTKHIHVKPLSSVIRAVEPFWFVWMEGFCKLRQDLGLGKVTSA